MENMEKKTPRLTSTGLFLKRNKNTVIRYGLLLLIVVIFGIATGGRLFSSFSISSLIGQIVPLMILCVGLSFVFAHGNFDISAGAVLALNSLISIEIINAMGCTGLSVFVALVVSVLLSEIFYLLNIFVSIKFRIMSTIGSLAIMFSARGAVSYLVSKTLSGYKLNDIKVIDLFKQEWFMIVVAAVIAVLGWIILTYTRFGKYDKALGDNPLSAQQSGAKLNSVRYVAYAIAGFCVGIASMFYLARSGSVTQNFGSGREMDIMIALIMGGMMLSGGTKTRMSSAVVGAISYVLLTNGLSQLGLSDAIVLIIKSAIFIVMVATTLRRSSTIKAMPR
ncbi:MAG: ABC transporter permease [Faecousia sp.]